MSNILVTGATGALGNAVINALLNKTKTDTLSIMVRDSKKAEDLKGKGVDVRTGDYSDYTSLLSAFKGIDKLYFVSGNDIVNRAKQQENVVKAAKEAGVKHILYTSFERHNETETSPLVFIADAHLKTENWIKESGMAYTILKHNLYMDILPMFIGDKVLETGTIFLPAGEGKTAFTLRQDMAEVSAVILTTDGHENKVYDISTDAAVSFSEIAAAISKISGKEIRYISPAPEEFVKALTDAGVPEQFVGMTADFAEGIKQQEFNKTSDIIERLTGRKPFTVNEYLKETYFSKN